MWLNPEPEDRWKWTPSVGITRELVGGRMFPLTLDGLDAPMRELKRGGARSRSTGLTNARELSAARRRVVLGASDRAEFSRSWPAECALISASTMSEWPFGSTFAQCLTILPSGPIRKVWRLASLRDAGAEQHAVLLRNLFGRIGEDVEGQAVFLGEFLVRGDVVDAHAQDHGVRLAEREDVVAQLTGLGGAAAGEVLRVEIQHHPLALVLVERVPLARLVL